MSKKRRIFDISMPEDLPPASSSDQPVDSPEPNRGAFPGGKVQAQYGADKPRGRRGPMATAISETGAAVQERRAAEDLIRAENDALAHEHVRLKKAGLITDLIALDDIMAEKLLRDRRQGVDLELGELKASIADVGLSNPIRVERCEDGKYELVQGYRRLAAFRELLAETGNVEAYGKIPAGIFAAGAELDELYRKMVDENLVRKDISFAEMARLARDYASHPETDCDDTDRAVAVLFKSAGYQKRSYIRAFAQLLDLLDKSLAFPEAIPRALGLKLRKRMEEVPGIPGRIAADLRAMPERDAEAELAVLRRYAGDGEPEGQGPSPRGRSGAKTMRKPKTTFQIERPEGPAKCTASAGRLEIKLPRDFSDLDRRKLEQAVAHLLDSLD